MPSTRSCHRSAPSPFGEMTVIRQPGVAQRLRLAPHPAVERDGQVFDEDEAAAPHPLHLIRLAARHFMSVALVEVEFSAVSPIVPIAHVTVAGMT